MVDRSEIERKGEGDTEKARGGPRCGVNVCAVSKWCRASHRHESHCRKEFISVVDGRKFEEVVEGRVFCSSTTQLRRHWKGSVPR